MVLFALLLLGLSHPSFVSSWSVADGGPTHVTWPHSGHCTSGVSQVCRCSTSVDMLACHDSGFGHCNVWRSTCLVCKGRQTSINAKHHHCHNGHICSLHWGTDLPVQVLAWLMNKYWHWPGQSSLSGTAQADGHTTDHCLKYQLLWFGPRI